MSELPPSWSEAAIEDVALVNPPYRSDLPTDVPVSFVPMAAVEAGTGHVDTSEIRFAGELQGKSYRSFEEGDVLFAKITPCMENGKMAVARKLCSGYGFGSTEFHVLRVASGINPDYLLHFVSHERFRRDAARNMKGTAGQLRVPKNYLKEQRIPVPPAAEQERIVAVIDEQFSRLDAGVEALARLRRNLSRMRVAVLDAAVAGRLVGGAEPTPTRRIGEIIKSLEQGWSPRCERISASDRDWAVIKTSAVHAMRFDDSANKRLPPKMAPREGLEIVPGDLLITRAGPRARAGVCCLVGDSRPRLMICDKVYRFRADIDAVLPEYLELALNAPVSISAIDRIKTGISDSGVNITQATFQALEIPVPSIKRQADIVKTVDGQLARIAEAESDIAVIEARGRQLRSSILSAAFSGELVSQNVNDEPATVLLERIVGRPLPNGSQSSNASRRSKATA